MFAKFPFLPPILRSLQAPAASPKLVGNGGQAGNHVRSTFWLATSAVALLLAVVAVLGLRGTAPPIGAILDPPATTQAAHAAVPAPAPAPLDRPPSFDIVKVDPSGQAVIAGRAAPGARVRVLDGDTPIGEATADARG